MNIKMFELAKKASKNSNHHTHKVGAVLTYRNKIVSTGYNKLKTHPRSTHPYFSLHAEMDAILKCKDKVDAIYIYRENRMGEPALSKPCKYCQKLIDLVGINKVYYTINGGYNWAVSSAG